MDLRRCMAGCREDVRRKAFPDGRSEPLPWRLPSSSVLHRYGNLEHLGRGLRREAEKEPGRSRYCLAALKAVGVEIP